MKKSFLAVIAIVLLLPAMMNAKPEKYNFGLFLGGNMNMHAPDYTITTGNDATYNENINSFGYNFGIVGNYAINKDLYISGRIGYHSLNAEFDQYMDPKVDYIYTTKQNIALSYLEISPMVQIYNLLPISDLYFLAGVELGLPILKSYDETASISEFSSTDNEIPDASIRAAIALGLGYTFDISKNTFLSPELSFRFPFTKVSSNAEFDSWTAPQLRFGINLTFSLSHEEKAPEIPATTYKLDAGISEVRYKDKNGTVKPVNKVTVEEVQYQELFPLIPYVFFDEMSVEQSKKVKVSDEEKYTAGEFKIEDMEPNAVKINSRTLDIIGKRMQINPNSRITITGTNDNIKEKGQNKLSELRAEFAKDYLVENFNIAPERITVESRALPAKPSSSKDEDGREENRRIEISTTNPDILQPIVIEKDRQRLADPELVEFIPYITTEDSITSWSLEISQTGKQIRKFEGATAIDRLQWNILPNELAASQIPLEYDFKVMTNSGLESKTSGTIPVDYYSYSRKKVEDRPDQTISKFSLVVFPFDSPEISQIDKSILERNVIPAIEPNSKVQIYGYTDRIGNEGYNKKLAMQRAENVMKLLKSKMPDVKYEVFGVGEEVEIFDNNLPTGRQLSRTVQIYVITPKK